MVLQKIKAYILRDPHDWKLRKKKHTTSIVRQKDWVTKHVPHMKVIKIRNHKDKGKWWEFWWMREAWTNEIKFVTGEDNIGPAVKKV